MGSVGTLASAAGRPGRAQEGTEGGSVRPLFQHFHAPRLCSKPAWPWRKRI